MLGQCIDSSHDFDHDVTLFLRSWTSSTCPSILYLKNDRGHDLLIRKVSLEKKYICMYDNESHYA